MLAWLGGHVADLTRTLFNGPAQNLGWSTLPVERTDRANQADEARVRGLISRLPTSVRKELEAGGVGVLVTHDSVLERHPTLRGIQAPSGELYDDVGAFYHEHHRRIVVAASRVDGNDFAAEVDRALESLRRSR
jgi:hypothetical protein